MIIFDHLILGFPRSQVTWGLRDGKCKTGKSYKSYIDRPSDYDPTEGFD